MAPSTLGTFLRSFTFGHVRQLDRVLARSLERLGHGGAALARKWRTQIGYAALDRMASERDRERARLDREAAAADRAEAARDRERAARALALAANGELTEEELLAHRTGHGVTD